LKGPFSPWTVSAKFPITPFFSSNESPPRKLKLGKKEGKLEIVILNLLFLEEQTPEKKCGD